MNQPTANGAIINGANVYYYGETVNLEAVIYRGFDFVGWYLAEDVLEGYDLENRFSLDHYSLVAPAVIEQKTPISTDLTYSFIVTQDQDIIAITKGYEASEASVEISGNNLYQYGYSANSVDRVLSAKITMPEEADATNYVYSYQWYETIDGTPTAIYGANSASYNFPANNFSTSGKSCLASITLFLIA